MSTPTITHDNVHESGPHHFITEASDLGLAPGQFPEQLETTIGNKQPFLRHSVGRDGSRVNYDQSNGCTTLTIFND